MQDLLQKQIQIVSTHSRLKAAGLAFTAGVLVVSCFNTQPPEGGWKLDAAIRTGCNGFNTQPPEGGWFTFFINTHKPTGFNTQPPEGGWKTIPYNYIFL